MTKLVQDKRPDLINVLEAESPKELGLIPAWSYSALKTYETCAYRSYIGKFKDMREGFINATVELEGEWGFTIDWEPCGWMEPGVWARIKLDAYVEESETSARVIDYKTGKQYGNEIAHSQQALTYAIGSFLRYPDLEIARTELWYLDHGTTMEKTYTRDQAMMFLPKLQERAINMTTATKFPPNPSTNSCRWCSFGKGEDPYCEWAIK